MKKRRKHFWKILFVVLLVIYLTRIFSKDTTTEQQVSYSEFMRMLNTEEIISIELEESSSKASFSTRDNESNTSFTVRVPNEEVFIELIQNQILEGQNIEFSIKENKTSIGDIIIPIFMIVYIIFLLYSIISGIKSLKNSEKTLKDQLANFAPNTDVNYGRKLAKSTTKFSDVAGLDEEKLELTDVVDFMKNPEKYTKLGAETPKGILLAGAPGTGKTLLAKAVAGEAGVAFIPLSGAEFVEKYVGVGASRIRSVFREAEKNAPCIIFIDEIDAIGANRNDNTGSTEHNQTLEQLLIELDGFKSRNDIVILAATNRPESLDPALTRPGRFDRKIQINLPDIKGREEILKVHGKNKPFLDDVDFQKIAYNTAGFSGAELENLLNESALCAARKHKDVIGAEEIDEAFMKITVGLKKAGRIISEKERKITAYHEAGHAVVSMFLPTQAKIKEVSIIPRGKAGGYTWHEQTEDKNYISQNELSERLMVLMAGREAESIFIGDISSGASNDISVATDIAKQMIMSYGMDSDIGPIKISRYYNNDFLGESIFNEVSNKVRELLKNSSQKAKDLIISNSNVIEALVELLLEKETVTGEEISSLIGDKLSEENKNTL